VFVQCPNILDKVVHLLYLQCLCNSSDCDSVTAVTFLLITRSSYNQKRSEISNLYKHNRVSVQALSANGKESWMIRNSQESGSPPKSKHFLFGPCLTLPYLTLPAGRRPARQTPSAEATARAQCTSPTDLKVDGTSLKLWQTSGEEASGCHSAYPMKE